MRKLLTEFVGTMLFVFAIVLLATSGNPMAPLGIGGMLMVMVYMGGHISGGHYNPAVSLAILLRGLMKVEEMVMYWVSQIVGAVAGAGLAYMVSGRSFEMMPEFKSIEMAAKEKGDVGAVASMMQLRTDVISPLGASIIVEALFTFALCLVVLNVATAKKTSGNSFYGLAIGFTIIVAAFAGGPISGGAFNPAVATGPTIIHMMFKGGGISNLWIYFAGPLIGAIIAAALFKVQEKEDAAAEPA